MPAKPPAPAKDITCAVKRNWLIDLKRNRDRIETEEQHYDRKAQSLYTESWVMTYDGSVIKGQQHRDPPLPSSSKPTADVGIGSGNLRGADIEFRHWPVFWSLGIVPLLTDVQLRRDTIAKVSNPPEQFYLHGQAVLRGRKCEVLRTLPHGESKSPSFSEIWVDTERDCSIARWVNYSSEQVMNSIEVEYQQLPEGWFPQRWRYQLEGAGRNRLQFEETIEVKEVAINAKVADSDFDIEVKPGMLVAKTRYGDTTLPSEVPSQDRQYYRAADGGALQEVTFQDGHERRVKHYWIVWAIAGAVLLLGLALVARRCARRHEPVR
jgi:hypothetical protein